MQGHIAGSSVVLTGLIVSGDLIGMGNSHIGPAQEGITLRRCAGIFGQGHNIAAVSSCGGKRLTVVCVGNGHLGSGGKIDLNGAVAGCVHDEAVAALGHSCGAADQLIAGDHVALSRFCSDIGAGNGDSTHGAVVDGGCNGVGFVSIAGRGGHAGRDFLAEEQEGQLGIVNKNVTGAGDLLHNVITGQLPGIDGVFCHPVQKDVLALHHAACAPHIGSIAPACVHVERNTSHVAMQIATADVGIKVAGASAIGGITAAAVLVLSSGAKHHDVIFLTGAIGSFALRPGMLPVPGGAAIPSRTDGGAAVEGGNLTVFPGAALLAVRILIKTPGFVIAGLVGMLAGHQILQLGIQGAAGHRINIRRAGIRCQGLVRSVAVEILSSGAQGRGCDTASALVIGILRCMDMHRQAGKQADDHDQHQEHRHAAFKLMSHRILSVSVCTRGIVA